MFWYPARDEAMAMRLEDIASALDAGLSAETVLSGAPTAGLRGQARTDRGLVAGLIERGLHLAPTERLVLEAAETSGNLPRSLRGQAAARRQRADLLRDLIRRAAYPVFLLLASLVVVALLVATRGGAWRFGIWLVVPAALVLAAWVLKRLVKRADFTGAGVPGLRPLLADLAEVPYLEALAGLYGAGVALVEAHAHALRAVPLASARARLYRAERQLEDGGGALTEALAQHGAVCAETLQLLTPAEQSGTLEEALYRALERRRHTLAIRAGRAVRLLGVAVYALAVVYVALLVIDFYSGLYGALGGR